MKGIKLLCDALFRVDGQIGIRPRVCSICITSFEGREEGKKEEVCPSKAPTQRVGVVGYQMQ